jgi:ABC-type siderophore export system fused ATPase/permease subunit
VREWYRLLIENKYAAAAAVVGFLLTLLFTRGSLMAAFGVLALIAGLAWAARQLHHRRL